MYVSHLRGGGGTLRSHLTDLDDLDTNRGGHLGGTVGVGSDWDVEGYSTVYVHAHTHDASPSLLARPNRQQTPSRLRARLGPTVQVFLFCF